LEKEILPKLKTVTALGIPKGRDGYWEFAHLPTRHVETTLAEIGTLRSIGLLPNNQKHSLQITLGGLKRNKDVYMLLGILEISG
jgi:hypothetical protein